MEERDFTAAINSLAIIVAEIEKMSPRELFAAGNYIAARIECRQASLAAKRDPQKQAR